MKLSKTAAMVPASCGHGHRAREACVCRDGVSTPPPPGGGPVGGSVCANYTSCGTMRKRTRQTWEITVPRWPGRRQRWVPGGKGGGTTVQCRDHKMRAPDSKVLGGPRAMFVLHCVSLDAAAGSRRRRAPRHQAAAAAAAAGPPLRGPQGCVWGAAAAGGAGVAVASAAREGALTAQPCGRRPWH